MCLCVQASLIALPFLFLSILFIVGAGFDRATERVKMDNMPYERPGFEILTPASSNITVRTRHFLQRPTKPSDEIPGTIKPTAEEIESAGKEKLGQWLATGICGNNITSSALYVVALCSVPAGKYAPVALLIIACLLYLFRRIYEEVVTALPVNGGTYNLLLNTTTKTNASIAACLTMLSYVTTAVISATSAMRYLHTLCGNCAEFDVLVMTAVTIAVAAVLNLVGISESAIVALAIFVFHMVSMALLIVACLAKAVSDMPTVEIFAGTSILSSDPSGQLAAAATASTFEYSLASATCSCTNATMANATAAGAGAAVEVVSMLTYNWVHTTPAIGIFGAIYFGFASALLGVSGFESSSNFVENQAPGVFPLTLRNMWTAVTIINPSIALLAQCLLPIDAIAGQAEEGALLSIMALKAAGPWLQYIIVVDAATVLIGAVITAFVGFTGLVHRMTVDRCLPQVFLRVNTMRNTRHWIIIGFWILTTALVFITEGNVEVLAGVYTVAFLSVMFSFAVGNMLLKVRRAELPTPVHVKWSVVMVAALAIFLGLLGNIISRPRSLGPLLLFGTLFIIPVQMMLRRRTVLGILIAITGGEDDDDEDEDDGGVQNPAQSKKRRLSAAGKERQEKIQLDDLFMEAMATASKLLNADRATLWLVDNVNKELWSKVAVGIPAIRVPLGAGIVGWVTNHLATLNIPDAYKDDRFNPGVDKKTGYKTNTILCMPIMNEDQKLVGVMQMINKNGKGEVFSDEDELVLKDFCSRIAVAVEKVQELGVTPHDMVRILKRLRKQLQHTKKMEELFQKTTPKTQLDHLFTEAMACAHNLMSCDRTSLWIVDHETKELWTRIADLIEPLRIPVAKGVVGWAATQGEIVNVLDAYKDPRFNPAVDKKSGYRTQHILSVPIRSPSSKKVLGVIQAINKMEAGTVSPKGFTRADEENLLDFCKVVSNVIDSVHKTNATRNEIRDNVKILEQQVAEVRAKMVGNYSELFESSVDSARSVLKADRCSLWLIDKAKGELWSKIAQGTKPLRMPLDTGFVGACAKSGAPLVVPLAYEDERFNSSFDKSSGYVTKSVLCCPIFDNDKAIIGVLQAINKLGKDGKEVSTGFDVRDKVAGNLFCKSIAAAIVNCEKKAGKDEELTETEAKAEEARLFESSMEISRFSVNAEALVAEKELEERSLSSEILLSESTDKKQTKRRNSLQKALSMGLDSGSKEQDQGGEGGAGKKPRSCLRNIKANIHNWACRYLQSLTHKPVVYFTKDDSPKALANAVRYVLANEQRCWIKFVRVYKTEKDIPDDAPEVYQYLLDSHPQLIIEYVAMVGKFGPALVRELSHREHIPSTFMFMGSFGESFEYTFTEMGGLRLITDNVPLYKKPKEENTDVAATKIQAIFRRNKVKKRFSALNATLVPSPKNSDAKNKATIPSSATKPKKLSDEDEDKVIMAPRLNTFTSFDLSDRPSRSLSRTTDDVIMELELSRKSPPPS